MPKPSSPQRLFGEVVRAERTKLHLSQEELAHHSGLNRVFMAVSIDTIAKIVAALKVKGGELLTKA